MRHESTRRIEQLVTRNGQRIKVSAEFRGSEIFGLPSTSDRDKYLAFMRIAMEQRAGRATYKSRSLHRLSLVEGTRLLLLWRKLRGYQHLGPTHG